MNTLQEPMTEAQIRTRRWITNSVLFALPALLVYLVTTGVPLIFQAIKTAMDGAFPGMQAFIPLLAILIILLAMKNGSSQRWEPIAKKDSPEEVRINCEMLLTWSQENGDVKEYLEKIGRMGREIYVIDIHRLGHFYDSQRKQAQVSALNEQNQKLLKELTKS